MKRNCTILILALLLMFSLSACVSPDAAGATPGSGGQSGHSDADSRTASQPAGTQSAAKPLITADRARAIALEHAGLTIDQVQGLHVEYDKDDGVPEYEVTFHLDRWEYEYEIHAETGEIRSYNRDD